MSTQAVNKDRVVQVFSIGDSVLLEDNARLTIKDLFIVVRPRRDKLVVQAEIDYKDPQGEIHALTCYAEELKDLILNHNIEKYKL